MSDSLHDDARPSTPERLASPAAVCAATPPVFLAQSSSSSAKRASRSEHLRDWVAAGERHQPGIVDAAVAVFDSWRPDDFEYLSIDLNTVLTLIKDPSLPTFFYTSEGRRIPRQVVYGGSVTLVTTSSLGLLEERLGRPVASEQFRSTFLLDTPGLEPHAEDDGRHLRRRLPELRILELDVIAARADTLAGEPIIAKLTSAPGNGASIGGLKVVTNTGWFAARPSGTEDIYKIYAESFKDQSHLAAIIQEAQEIVTDALKSPDLALHEQEVR